MKNRVVREIGAAGPVGVFLFGCYILINNRYPRGWDSSHFGCQGRKKTKTTRGPWARCSHAKGSFNTNGNSIRETWFNIAAWKGINFVRGEKGEKMKLVEGPVVTSIARPTGLRFGREEMSRCLVEYVVMVFFNLRPFFRYFFRYVYNRWSFCHRNCLALLIALHLLIWNYACLTLKIYDSFYRSYRSIPRFFSVKTHYTLAVLRARVSLFSYCFIIYCCSLIVRQ